LVRQIHLNFRLQMLSQVSVGRALRTVTTDTREMVFKDADVLFFKTFLVLFATNLTPIAKLP